MPATSCCARSAAPGQAALKRARVLVVGAGGLGAPVLLYLAAAGVGTLGVVDDDTVSLSNLQRQVIHGTPDIGAPKVESAAAAIRRLNPHVAVETHADAAGRRRTRSTSSAATTSSPTARTISPRAISCPTPASSRKKPLVTAAVGTFDGTLTTIRAHERGPTARPTRPIAACFRSRRRPAPCRPARRPASSARSPACSAR